MPGQLLPVCTQNMTFCGVQNPNGQFSSLTSPGLIPSQLFVHFFTGRAGKLKWLWFKVSISHQQPKHQWVINIILVWNPTPALHQILIRKLTPSQTEPWHHLFPNYHGTVDFCMINLVFIDGGFGFKEQNGFKEKLHLEREIQNSPEN